MTQPDKPRRWTTVGWWSIWAIAFIVSLLPPIVHHWRQIADIIEPLRYPWHPGFLPAELLFLRHLGELAHWIPVVLIGLLAIGIYKRQARNATIAIGALIAAVFSSIYGAYCLIVVSIYLVGYTDATQNNQQADGAGPAPTRLESR